MTDYSAPASHLRQDFEKQSELFASQTTIVQRFLESQGRLIANGLMEKTGQIRFRLPDRVIIPVRQIGQPAEVVIPAAEREQRIGNAWERLKHAERRQAIQHRLRELEQSPDDAIAASAGMVRFAAASYMISEMLPAGRDVVYRAEDNETIPSIPVEDLEPESALTQASDAIVEQGGEEAGRGELQTPFVPAARKFFLPQWVAFDEKGKLLVGSEAEAEAHVRSMQNYAEILHTASALAAYMVASEEYQRKRYGILGQLVNQGRALAIYRTNAIIREIKERVQAGSLNRGLSISMPYFDDQALQMKETRFEIIPAGRIMFIPAFVVRAAREEQAKVGQDTRFNPSTRKHLLQLLKTLENEFISFHVKGELS